MPGNVARRRMEAANEARRNIKVLADGAGSSRQMAAQASKDRVMDFQIQYTSPQGEGGEIIQALLPHARYEFGDECDGNQLAFAAVSIARDLAHTAGFDQPDLYWNLDCSATAVSGRGIGFGGAKLMTFAPRRTNVAQSPAGGAASHFFTIRSWRATWVGN